MLHVAFLGLSNIIGIITIGMDFPQTKCYYLLCLIWVLDIYPCPVCWVKPITQPWWGTFFFLTMRSTDLPLPTALLFFLKYTHSVHLAPPLKKNINFSFKDHDVLFSHLRILLLFIKPWSSHFQISCLLANQWHSRACFCTHNYYFVQKYFLLLLASFSFHSNYLPAWLPPRGVLL